MRQIMPIAGAVVGGMFGAPQLGFAIGSMIGNIVDPIEIQGRKLGDAPTQVAAEGGARAIVFGKGCVRAVVLMERGGRTVKKQRARGGKGGPKQEGDERAYWTYAIGIGEAIPDGGLLRIWENEKLVYDVTPDSQIVADSTEFAKLFRFYDGAEDQLPDPAIEAIYTDPTDAPYYRGTAYMVFPQRDLTDFGEAVPTYRVEVASVVDLDPGGDAWEYSQSFGNNLLDSAYGGGKFMIVGTQGSHGYGQIWMSDRTGKAFQQLDAPDGKQYTAVAYGNGIFMASASSGVVVYDGNTFTERSASYSEAYLVLVYSGGYFYRMGFNLTVERSTNGDVWYPQSRTPGGGAIRHAIVVGDRIVAASTDTLLSGDVVDTVWEDGTISGGDPYPLSPFHALNHKDGVIRAYKEPSFGTMAIYTSTDGGDTYTVSVHSVGTDWVVRRSIGIVNGVWVGGGIDAESPDYPSLLASPDGLPPFAPQTLTGGPGTASDSGFIIVVDSQEGVGIALGRQVDGTCFTFVNTYRGSTIAGDPIPLYSVVAALHNRCGHEATDYDVTALTDMIDGVVIESTQTGAEAINSLIGTHWADPADYDGKIRYIKRGAAVVRTLTIDDLIDEPETWQRNNAIEYPAKMHFFGQISDLAYASVKATSARYSADAKVVGEASVSSPETFNTSQRPYEIAAILHKIMWTEAGGEVTWRVTDQHLDLVPTDCVGLSWAGQLWRARITQIEADPGELKLKMMLDRQSAYTANLTAIPIPPAPTTPQTSIVSDTMLAVMDIPALVDAADDLHIVTAMSGETDAWAGGTLQRSLDAGASFATVSSSTLNAIMGTLQAPVTAASPHYTDTTNVVDVLLYTDDEIEAISEQAFLSEGGAFALSWNDSGAQRWELMQYRDVELIAPKTYRLTTLHRGQLNTEAAAHPTNAVFVLLDGAIQAHTTQSAWIGQDLTHRAVSNGHTPDGADEQTLTYAGNSQREFPVAHLLLSRAGDDVTATAVPRHRFGTDDAPIRSLNWDGYRWTVTDGVNTVTRDGTADTETFDATGWASPVTVTVAQLNRITGAGPSVSEGIA